MKNSGFSSAVFGVFTLLTMASSVVAQDLFEKDNLKAVKVGSDKEIRVRVDPTRLDLRLAPDYVPKVPSATSSSSKMFVKSSFDYDFACGKFDIRANYKQLLSKEVGEEFLQNAIGMLQAKLAKSGMVFLCETSPTICQAFQHYRISANALLRMNYDRCAAIEGALDTVEKTLYTNSLKACMNEKRKAGMTIDQALEACRKTTKVRNLRGRRVKEFDLTREVADMLGLSKEARDLLGILGGETKYNAKGLEAKMNAKAVERRYLQHREVFSKAWESAIQAILEGRSVTEKELNALNPDRSQPFTREDLGNIALLDSLRRKAVLHSMASLAAKLKLDEEIREVERVYQAASMTPTADKKEVKALEQRVDWLRQERRRLEEAYRNQKELNDTILTIRSIGQTEMLKKVRKHYEAEKLRRNRTRHILETRPFGSRTDVIAKRKVDRKTSNAGKSCGTPCVGGDFSWGKK